MARSFRLYTARQFAEVKALADLVAEQSGVPPAKRQWLAALYADLQQRLRETVGAPPQRPAFPAMPSCARMRAEPVPAACYVDIFPGRADQVRLVRRAVASYLTGCPAADEAILIVSELAANAVTHSASRDRFFIVRAEWFPDYVWVEAEDLGGPWRCRQPAGRPHGLDVVEALVGRDGWGVETTTERGRVVWARRDLTTGE
jgi:serine/threonine-protein kinase RsbW